MKIKAYFAILVLAAALGCSQNPKPVTGAVNQFDSDSYLTLLTTDNVIQSTKQALVAGSFPASIAGNVKTALNGLITAYDVADTAYLAYHTAALSGTATAQQQAAVKSGLNNVSAATTTLLTAKGGQ